MVLNSILDTTSLIIVGIFLLVTLVVGLYAGRDVKDFKSYAIGTKRFSVLTLTLTYLATYIGAGTIIGLPSDIYKEGLIAIIICLFSGPLQALFFGYIIGPKIVKFKNLITIGDIYEKLYSKNFKIFVGLATTIFSLLLVSIQLFLLGNIFEQLTGLKSIYGIILSGSILGFYTFYGGMNSVTSTDVLHFVILFTFLPIIASICLKEVGGIKNLFISLPKEKCIIFGHKKFYHYLTLLLSWSILPMTILCPPFMHRIFLLPSKKRLKNKFLTMAAFLPFHRISILIIGLASIILLPNISNSKSIMSKIINLIITNPLLKGVAMSSIFAIIMSTIDSFYHAGGIVLYNDILRPLVKIKKNELKMTKLLTLIFCFLSVVIAINYNNNNIYFRNLELFAFKLIGPVLFAPLLLGILGLKPNKYSFFFSSFFGLLTFFLSNIYIKGVKKSLTLPISLTVSIVIYMIVHILIYKGIAIINRDYDQNKPQRIWKPTWQGFLETLFSYIPTPHKIFEFSRKSVSRCGANNMLFGIFVCINFIVPYFMWDHKNEDLYNLMIYLRFFGGLLGGLLIVKTEWKDFLKPYFPLFWHFTLLYCLPFISTVMFLLTNGSIIWLLNIGTSIFFLIMLTENIVFLTLTPIGIVLGILFYILRVGPVDLSSFGFEVNYQLIYQVLFSSTIGLLFSYRKKIFNSIKGNEGTNLGLAMCHELRNTGLYIYPAAQISLMYLKKYKDNLNVLNKENGYFIKEKDFEYIKEQNQEIERLGRLQKNIVGTFEKLLKEYRDSINDPQNFSMKHIVNQAIDQYIFKPGQKEKLDINLNKDFVAKIPKQVFIFVVDNIIRNSYKHGNPSKIKIWLEENELHIKDNGKGISEREMDLIFKMYFTNGDSSSSGIGLAFAKQIIEGFGGEIWVESQTGNSSYTEFIIKFPKVSEELSEEEIKENMELEIKKNIAKTMKEEGVEKSIIEKSIGISTDDMEGNE